MNMAIQTILYPSMNHSGEDKLYSITMEKITDFVFDDKVIRVFADMIRRSVPGYGTLLAMLPVIVRHFVTPGSQCYDLGCSQGACTLAIRHSLLVNNINIIAVDNSPAMVASCREQLAQDHGSTPVELVCDDICHTPVDNASLVVMNFTLQFIEPVARPALIKTIYNGLNDGGALLLSEKIQLADQDSELITELHEAFKRSNGYSELEISQKRTALEKVLLPETIEQHKQRLLATGFSHVTVWFQCFNFVSLLAVK